MDNADVLQDRLDDQRRDRIPLADILDGFEVIEVERMNQLLVLSGTPALMA